MNEPAVHPSTDLLRPFATQHPTFSQAFRFWLKLGFISFGGPTGQIAIMHEELVERRRWISEARFLHALNYCMLLPGPEAQQLAVYIGWLLHRTWGGIVAGSLFVLPGAVVLWIVSYVYVVYGSVPWIVAIFHGLKPAVVAIVAHAVLRIGKRGLKNEVMWAVAAAAFVAIFFFKVPFPAIIISAALIGLAGGRAWPSKFVVIRPHGSDGDGQTAVLHDLDSSGGPDGPTLGRMAKVLFICTALWAVPFLGLAAWGADTGVLLDEAVFFSKAALVTFGGAYAVLPYVAQQAVERFDWLSASQMLDGLGLAESTPGPLIMVLQFVGFLGAWNHPGQLSPLTAATLGAAITTWVTFVPCFLWIFLGAPYIERLRSNSRLSAALSAVTAAVVGVVLNLAVWFAGSVMFPGSAVDWVAVIVGAAAFAALVRWRLDVVLVVAFGAAAGLAHHLLSA